MADFIIWTLDEDDPTRAQLAAVRDAIAAHDDLTIARTTGPDAAPERLLVSGDEAALEEVLGVTGANVQVEQNITMQPLRGNDD